jgi:hypothetical protein
MNSWHPHLHSPFLWACLQATHLISSSCNTCVTGTATDVSVTGLRVGILRGWRSLGLSMFCWTTCSPLCPAGCSQRDPYLWKAQHCLMSVMCLLIGCYASCGLPCKSYSGVCFAWVSGEGTGGNFPPLTFSTYQPLVGGTKTYSGRESISLLLCECLDESILVCRKIQLLMAVLVPILLAIFLWNH